VERHHGSSEEARAQGSRKEGRGNALEKQSRTERSGTQRRPYTRERQGETQRFGSEGRSEAPVTLLRSDEKAGGMPAFLRP
jgi:hypothetical protein